MPAGDCIIMMAVGGGFLVLGLAGIFWGRYEERKYFDAMAARSDLREFMSHWPERPQPGAVGTGGWISLVLGGLLLLVGFILWLVGRGGA